MEQEQQHITGGIVVLRYWQVMILLCVQLIGLGAAYGRITSNQDNMKEEMGRRLTMIESNKGISREEFDAWRQEFQANLRALQQALIRRSLAAPE